MITDGYILSDMPDDFKIEHDRLVYEIEPLVIKLWDLIQSLPRPCAEARYNYSSVNMIIKKAKE